MFGHLQDDILLRGSYLLDCVHLGNIWFLEGQVDELELCLKVGCSKAFMLCLGFIILWTGSLRW